MSITDLCDIVPLWDPVTLEPLSEEQWLELRMAGIGGSEIGAIAGLNKYESAYSIYHRKVSGVNTFDGNEATDLGHHFEGPVAERYAVVKNAAVVEWPVILRSKEHPFISANVDRFVVEPSFMFPAGQVTKWMQPSEPPGIIGLLECKTGALASPGKPQEWDDNRIPPSYETQGMWYAGACGLPWVDYAALIGTKGCLFRRLEFDQEYFDNLVAIGEDFWVNYVLAGVEPPADGSDATADAIAALYPRSQPGKFINADGEFMDAWAVFQEAKYLAEQADDARKRARAAVIALIGDAEAVLYEGEPVCTYKSSKDSSGMDVRAFQAAHPDLYQQFEIVRNGSRRLVPARG